MNGKRLTLISLCMLVAGVAMAQGLPSFYPDRFQRTGTIDDVQNGTLVINDVPYALSDEVVVHSFVSAADVQPGILIKGMKIGFETGAQRQISEVWVLPDWYDPSRNRR